MNDHRLSPAGLLTELAYFLHCSHKADSSPSSTGNFYSEATNISFSELIQTLSLRSSVKSSLTMQRSYRLFMRSRNLENINSLKTILVALILDLYRYSETKLISLLSVKVNSGMFKILEAGEVPPSDFPFEIHSQHSSSNWIFFNILRFSVSFSSLSDRDV